MSNIDGLLADNVTEDFVTDLAAPATPEPINEQPQSRYYTEEDIARARSQEKEKLYSELDRLKDELGSLKKEREERESEEARIRAEAEEAARRKAEEEMDVRSLLEKKESEWEQQLRLEREERERAFALLEQERHFAELQSYRQTRIEGERDEIIPELLDLVSGNTREEIDASIESLRERSSRILDSAQQAMQAARRDMTGSRVTAPPAGPLDTNSEQQTFTAEQIAGMSFQDYAKYRSRLLGQASAERNRGLFG